jgi:WD40 repeat protein
MRTRTRNHAGGLSGLLLASAFLLAFVVDPVSAQTTKELTYWQDIRPIFRKHCTVCHSTKYLKEDDISGGLALDTFEAVRKGAKQPVVLPGKSGDSLLVHKIELADAKKRMPLDGKPLAAEKIALIRRWIDAGAKEGTKPDAGPEPVLTRKPVPTRKRDVVLATTTVPPKGALGTAAPAKLALSLRVGPLAPVVAVAFSPDGKLLASGTYGHVTIWDLASARPVKQLTNVLGAVNDLRFSPDGKLLATAGGQPSAKGDLRLYRVSDWKLLAALRGHEDVAFAIAFRPDGKYLASASFDKTVRIWNVTTHKLERTLSGHSDFVYAVAYSPDGKTLVSASKDRTVKVVEADTGKSLFTFSGMEQDVLAVAFSPDGKQVVSSGFEPALYWWSPQTGEKIRTQAGHGVAVHELCFSQDGKVVVSAGADKTVRVWDGTSGAPLRTLSVGSLVYATAISPNRKLIASGSFDGLIRLWDTGTGRHLLTLLALPMTKEAIEWLALTPEGYVTGSEGLASTGRWQMAGQDIAGARIWEALNQPDAVARAARGEAVKPPTFSK